VTLDILDNVFLLHLALEATKGILQRLSLLQSNFCQSDHLLANTNLAHLSLTDKYGARTARPAANSAPQPLNCEHS